MPTPEKKKEKEKDEFPILYLSPPLELLHLELRFSSRSFSELCHNTFITAFMYDFPPKLWTNLHFDGELFIKA